MADASGILRDLHRYHRQLSDLRERLQRGPKQIRAHEASTARFSDELNSVKAEAKAARVACDQKQLQLKSGEQKIVDLRRKLNEAASNREYQTLVEQIAADNMANSVLADEILEAMERLDDFAGKIAAAEARLAKGREELQKIATQVQAQEGTLRSEIARLEAELKEVERDLPHDFRDAYDRVVRSKHSDALAQVEGENCTGCNQVITPNMMNSLLMGRIVSCGCGRLLYLSEDRLSQRRES